MGQDGHMEERVLYIDSCKPVAPAHCGQQGIAGQHLELDLPGVLVEASQIQDRPHPPPFFLTTKYEVPQAIAYSCLPLRYSFDGALGE